MVIRHRRSVFAWRGLMQVIDPQVFGDADGAVIIPMMSNAVFNIMQLSFGDRCDMG